MGMFDYIRCEAPLPDGAVVSELQTKDFDCEMVTHVISAGGRLLLDQGHFEEVPQSERPYPDDDGWRAICGSIRRVPKYVDAQHHGWVNFYGTDAAGGWREYNAKFTDGQLVEIAACPLDEGLEP